MLPNNSNSTFRTLSRRQLTLTLASVSLIPVAIAVTMWLTMPDSPEPLLSVEVQIGPGTWPPDQAQNAKLMPCVIIRNPTIDRWDNVSLTLNDQYFYYLPRAVAANSTETIPLKHFVTKGHQAFIPDYHKLRLLTVYAQIPSGARAIRDIEF